MNRTALVLAALLVGVGLFMLPRKTWALPSRANPYAADIIAAERTNGIPDNMLGRLLWQESRFRPDIIDGTTKSAAGATGIAQIIPRFHPDVNPLDPRDSIFYAGKYLRENFNRFGQWELALAAYNWGPGNVNKALKEKGSAWFDALPTETKNYVTEITGDIFA